MDADELKTKNREFVEHWRRVGPLLERIRYRELRRMTQRERQRAIRAVLQVGVRFARPRKTSGLVEFQRLLARSKK
jgi:hypothetical protein